MFTIEDQKYLIDIKTKSDEYKKLISDNKQFSINNKELISWYYTLIELAEKLIAMEDIIESQNLQKLKVCSSSIMDSPSGRATNIKRNLDSILDYFYLIYPLMYWKMFHKKYRKD